MPPNAKKALEVDLADATELIQSLRRYYTEDQFGRILYRVLRRTATRTKTVTQREVPVDYNARKAWIGKAFGSPRITTGPRLECSIPLDGTRGYIGRQGVFKASATGGTASGGTTQVRSAYSGRRGKRSRRAYKLQAQIVAGQSTALPSAGKKQPHFMVFSGPHKGRVFVRLNKKGDKIRPAVGLGVPQMPMTRTRQAIQLGVLETFQNRLVHEHDFELQKAAGRWMR